MTVTGWVSTSARNGLPPGGGVRRSRWWSPCEAGLDDGVEHPVPSGRRCGTVGCAVVAAATEVWLATWFPGAGLEPAVERVRKPAGVIDETDVEGDEQAIARFDRFKPCRDDQGSPFGLHQRPSASSRCRSQNRPSRRTRIASTEPGLLSQHPAPAQIHRTAPRGATSTAAAPRPYRATSRSPCLVRSTPESWASVEMTCSMTSSVSSVSGSSYVTSM